MNDWCGLLKTACVFLDKAGIKREDWVFGGGTALAYYYDHRVSKDVDIFLWDVTKLTLLTPRLNDYVLNHVDGYDEAANYIKLQIGDMEIDFIVAPQLTDDPQHKDTVCGIDLQIENSCEIVIKKLFYRGYSLKPRDIFDISVALRFNEDSIRKNSVVLKTRIDNIRESLERNKNFYYEEVANLVIKKTDLIEGSLESVVDFISSI